jgi:hypothetical protein
MTGRVYKSVYGVLLGACVAVAAMILPGAAASHPAGRAPLTVVVLGKGAIVASTPAGISCPGRCTARFASGTRVTLIPRLKTGIRLVRWAGGCRGSGACAVRVSSPSAVTAVFGTAAKSKPQAKPTAPHSGSKVVAEPGYYSGPILFFVSTSGTKVQNVTTYNAVPISCVPAVSGAPPYDRNFAIPLAAIKTDGSFAGQITQDGVFDGFAAKITYSVAGHLTPASAAGAAATAAGSYRENITFKDATTTHTCTSNNQAWSSSKNGPIPQPKSLVVPAKKYSGPVIFSVSTAGTEVQNVTTYNAVPVVCVPAVTGAPPYDRNFSIPTATIRPDGSFGGQATQNGVFGNAPAKITYSVTGNFQGLNGSYATAAGSYREEITFTDSAGAHTCTSNILPFAASG